MGDASYSGSGGVGGVGDCTCKLATKSGPWETSGPQIDRIPSTRPSWRDRQYRELKKIIFFAPPVIVPLISLDANVHISLTTTVRIGRRTLRLHTRRRAATSPRLEPCARGARNARRRARPPGRRLSRLAPATAGPAPACRRAARRRSPPRIAPAGGHRVDPRAGATRRRASPRPGKKVARTSRARCCRRRGAAQTRGATEFQLGRRNRTLD